MRSDLLAYTSFSLAAPPSHCNSTWSGHEPHTSARLTTEAVLGMRPTWSVRAEGWLSIHCSHALQYANSTAYLLNGSLACPWRKQRSVTCDEQLAGAWANARAKQRNNLGRGDEQHAQHLRVAWVLT